MLKNYLKIAWRSLLRDKTFSIINILGFAMGMAAFLTIMQYVKKEFSYDGFHQDKERIYRIPQYMGEFGTELGDNPWAGNAPALYYKIKESSPEVEYVTRYAPQNLEEPYCITTYETSNGEIRTFNQENAFYADPEFLRVFSFSLIRGDQDKILKDEKSLVMTESTAKKYFGDEDPLGKVVTVRTGGLTSTKNVFSFKVEGILKDTPKNTQLKFDMLLPMAAFEGNYLEDFRYTWVWPCFHTYVKFKSNVNLTAFEKQLDSFIPAEERKAMNDRGNDTRSFLEPLSDTHFTNQYVNNYAQTTDKQFLLIIAFIAFFILIIAWMNYINLSTAKAINRFKEIGIRKVTGANRSQLTIQFLLESFLLNLVAMILAVTIAQVSNPYWFVLTGIDMGTPEWFQTEGTLLVLGILALSSLCSGFFPALVLSKLKPINALHQRITRQGSSFSLRKILVVFQFLISAVLIILTYALYLQIGHMRDREPGFDMNQRILVNALGIEGNTYQKLALFKNTLLTNPKIQSVAAGSSFPGMPGFGYQSFTKSPDSKNLIQVNINAVSHDYIKTSGLELLDGRDFSEKISTDRGSILLNETAMQDFGFKDPGSAIGRMVYYPRFKKEMKILGVVKDFIQFSGGSSPPPIVYQLENSINPYTTFNYFGIHIAGGDISQTVQSIQDQWLNHFKNTPFNYHFQDIIFDRIYETDRQIGVLSGIFSFLAIFIACLGLLGLAGFTTARRIKEIGIRKVLGASVSGILILLSKDFTRLIAMGIIIAIPLAYFLVEEFLADLDYRINPDLWLFLIPSLLLTSISLFAISFQIIKTARANPVEALRNE